jgi:hypothetical protein
MLKLVFYGHSGSGKSSSAGIARAFFEAKNRKVAVLKLAQPLYELQTQFYQAAGQDIDFYSQDQLLLENIATQLRRISPTSIVDHFLRRLHTIDADVVINDDLRDIQVDYPILKQHGFVFIRIFCKEPVRVARLNLRNDRSVIVHSATTTNIEAIEPHLVIDNSEHDFETLRTKLHTALEELL